MSCRLTIALAVLCATAALPAKAIAGGRADLVVRSATAASSAVSPGAAVAVRLVTRNAGRAKAKRSRTRLYLSRDRRKGAGDLRVSAAQGVGALRPRRSKRTTVSVRIPAVALGSYYLVACADDLRRVRERREKNNCRASAVMLTVTAAGPPVDPADPDGDGHGADDCAPADAAIHPGAQDAPDLAFLDSNCDGIDGAATGAVFVSPSGSDTAAGTRQAPLRSLAAALAAGKDVYLATGSYDGAATVTTAVGLYGGYSPTDWSRSTGAATEIVGAPYAIAVENVAGGRLQLLTLRGTRGTGASAYGLVTRSATVAIEGVRAEAGPGAPGTSGATPAGHGEDGGFGGTGNPGVERSGSPTCDNNPLPLGGTPGTSPAGLTGGTGGQPGVAVAGGIKGQDGMGPLAGLGGAGALGESLDGTEGDDGGAGSLGPGGSAGAAAYGAAGYAPVSAGGGTGGTAGSGGGGGGGGGGGTTDCDSTGSSGGGGGGGASGGSGGSGGSSGGGSFAVYSWGGHLSVSASALVSGAGGAGGVGADGQPGGTGGGPGPGGPYGGVSEQDDGGNGAPGGKGGDGGQGGAGGGGAGGPSVGLLLGGGAVADPTGVTFTLGAAGAGGASTQNAGPAGARAETLTVSG
jgi:hypothetical protein